MEDIEETDFTPQNYRTVNCQTAEELPDLFPAEILDDKKYPTGHASATSMYSGEMLFVHRPPFTGLEKQIFSRDLEDDVLKVRSTLNSTPQFIEQCESREDVIWRMKKHAMKMMFDNVRRLAHSNAGFQRMVSRRLEEMDFPAYKTESLAADPATGQPNYSPIGTLDDTGITQAVKDQAVADAVELRDLFQQNGLYHETAMLDWRDRLATLEDEIKCKTLFHPSTVGADGKEIALENDYYLLKRPDVDLVGFALYDHDLRADDPTVKNPNKLKPPVAVTHGLKMNVNINDAVDLDKRTVEIGDLVFSVFPKDPNVVIFPGDQSRLVRKIETTSFVNFLLHMARRNANADFSLYKTLGPQGYSNLPWPSLPLQRTQSGSYIYGDVVAFFDPTVKAVERRWVPQTATVEVVGAPVVNPDTEVAATETVSPAVYLKWAENPQYWMKEFIGDSLSRVSQHGGKFLMNYALSF